MRVLHFVADIDERFGGPARTVSLLSEALAELDIQSEIVYIETLPKSRNEIVERGLIRTHGFQLSLSRKLYFSLGLEDNLRHVVSEFRPDIVHVHSIWRLPAWTFLRLARRTGIPLVTSLHSNLYPESLARSSMIKRFARWGYVDALLAQSRIVHATEPREAEAAEAFGIDVARIVTIPNGLEPPSTSRAFGADRIDLAGSIPLGISSADRIALFLARIHARKNTLELVNAAREVISRHPEWKLVVAGPCEDDAYLRRCKAAAGPLLDAGRIVFLDMLRGEAKHAMLAAADLFLLPTKFENFGLSIGEALAVGLPVVTTTTTPWHQISEAGAGWIIPPENQSALVAAWSAAAACDDATLRAMGARGTPLTQAFTWDSVAMRFAEVYQSFKPVLE